MDPATLAGLAIGALVRYLAAKGARLAGRAGGDVDRAVDQRLDRLYETVRARIVDDRTVERTLDQLEADPADKRQQGRLEYALENLLDSDPAFAAKLAALLDGLADQHQGGVTVRDAGPVAFGGNVHQRGQYVAGRDLDVGRDRER